MAATEQGYSIQPLMSPVLFFMELLYGDKSLWSPQMLDELLTLRPQFNRLLNNEDCHADMLLFRLVRSSASAKRSYRQPLDQVCHYH